MGRLGFCLYIFGPIFLGYFLPIVLYEWPIKIRTVGSVHDIAHANFAMAIFACLIWFGIAIFIVSYSNLFSIKNKTPVRSWNDKARWVGFLCFSIVGCLIAILHRIFLMPEPIEQSIHQLSLMPTIGFILGICCLQDKRNQERKRLKKTLILIILGLDSLIIFSLPVIFGVIGGVALSAVGILFGLAVIGVRPLKQIVAFSIFAIIILGGLSVKHTIRILMCGSTCERIPIQNFFGSESTVEMAKGQVTLQKKEVAHTPKFLRGLESSEMRLSGDKEYSKGAEQPTSQNKLEGDELQKSDAIKKKEDMLAQVSQIKGEFLKTLESKKRGFSSGYDPNFQRIRIVPSQLENSLAHYFIGRILHRLNRLGELGYVIQTTGSEIPYAYGSTYFLILTKVIPRMVWANKPKENAGQFFGHRYRFINDSDLKTSFNLPMIVEGYMNWGWFGIVFSAVFVGIVLRLVWEFWIGRGLGTGNVILGMVVVMSMVLQGSNLSLRFGDLLYGGLIYWTLEVLFRNNFIPKPTVSLANTHSSFDIHKM